MTVLVKNITSHPLVLRFQGRSVPLLSQQTLELPESALLALAPWIPTKLSVVKSQYQIQPTVSDAPAETSVTNVETMLEYQTRTPPAPETVEEVAPPKRSRKRKPKGE